VVVVVIPVIGHRVSDRRAADAAHHRADRTADESPADSADDPSGYRAGAAERRHAIQARFAPAR